jgi:hypothetical protein
MLYLVQEAQRALYGPNANAKPHGWTLQAVYGWVEELSCRCAVGCCVLRLFCAGFALGTEHRLGFRGSSMKSKAEPSLASQIPTVAMICFSSIVAGLAIFLLALALQWFIYDDWLHKSGPLRLIGSALASALTFGFFRENQVDERQNSQFTASH